MPTYDYVCDACDHSFELFQSIKDDAKKKCPECGKQKLRRLIGPGAAIVFKGSGFYQTDYRSDSYKKRAEADKPASESKSSGKESGGKDTAAKPSETKSSGKSKSSD
jgi:putative FmdB family regulatory protein